MSDGVKSILLIVLFQGEVHRLIPLYAVGVFLSFTLSQTGMVRHHLKERAARWRLHVGINATGAVATFVVLMIVGITKFTSGAWLPIVVIPLIVTVFKGIKRHFSRNPSTSRTTLASVAPR